MISILQKFCFTVLPLVRTWLIRTVLPLEQDLAYLKLTAFFGDFFASKIMFYSPTVGTDLAYSYGPAVETGPGLLKVNGFFP